jgi:hypothetical protein
LSARELIHEAQTPNTPKTLPTLSSHSLVVASLHLRLFSLLYSSGHHVIALLSLPSSSLCYSPLSFISSPSILCHSQDSCSFIALVANPYQSLRSPQAWLLCLHRRFVRRQRCHVVHSCPHCISPL